LNLFDGIIFISLMNDLLITVDGNKSDNNLFVEC